MTYTHSNPPPVKPNTSGHLRPKPEGTTAACMAPVDIEWPYPENWGKPPGATMLVKAGEWITCLGLRDSYRNDEFRATCSLTGAILDPAQDERAAEIASYWQEQRGLQVLVVESQKTAGAVVIGEVADEAIGKDLETAEGPETLQDGDVIIRSPRRADRLYRITPANRKKRYRDDGKIFPGELPEEFR